MATTYLESTKEYKGVIPPMGVKLRIDELERTESKSGKLMYVLTAEIVEPEDYANVTLKEWIVIGTDKDKKAKKEATWKSAEGGPGRLKRLLARSGTPLSNDDDEWMEAAQGNLVCAHVTVQADDTGRDRNRIDGQYFRETDKDFIGVGESLVSGNGKKGKVVALKPKAALVEDDDDDTADEAPPAKTAAGKKAKPPVDEDDDDDTPPAAAKKAKNGKAAAKPADDDEEDDD
jgi:hypothetical protein